MRFEPDYGTRKGILLGWLQITAGLFVFSFGVYLTIFAGIGLAPWDCLAAGISLHTPLNYGMAMTCISILVLGIDLLLGEQVGFGTVLNALVIGGFVQMFSDLNPFQAPETLPVSILVILFGLTVMAFGQYYYIRSAQGCGPRDALLIGIGKRMKKVPIGFVQIIILAAVLLIGFLLGGPIGIGTVLTTFGSGLLMQVVFRIMRFEPRNVVQHSISDLLPVLLQK